MTFLRRWLFHIKKMYLNPRSCLWHTNGGFDNWLVIAKPMCLCLCVEVPQRFSSASYLFAKLFHVNGVCGITGDGTLPGVTQANFGAKSTWLYKQLEFKIPNCKTVLNDPNAIRKVLKKRSEKNIKTWLFDLGYPRYGHLKNWPQNQF